MGSVCDSRDCSDLESNSDVAFVISVARGLFLLWFLWVLWFGVVLCCGLLDFLGFRIHLGWRFWISVSWGRSRLLFFM